MANYQQQNTVNNNSSLIMGIFIPIHCFFKSGKNLALAWHYQTINVYIKYQKMKGTKIINSVKSKARFHEQIVERYLQNNLPPSSLRRTKISGLGHFSQGYKEVEFCAAETPVLGSIEIVLHPDFSSVIDKIVVPVTSRFFVSCVRDNSSVYKVATSASLS